MPDNTRMFMCNECEMIEFMITVEPNYPIDDEKKSWLDDCSTCPNCGCDLEFA